MPNNYKLTYNVDMVFCIDSTGSMDSIIDMVKQNALNFYTDVSEAMTAKRKTIDTLRIKVISYKDYIADGVNAMLNTSFFALPAESDEFCACVNSITAEGGGDDPEDGLEAVAYAIRSQWNTEGKKRRQIVVVWSDAPTHELGYGASSPFYPKRMAQSFDELTRWWGGRQLKSEFIDNDAKRLILFTPVGEWWTMIVNTWNNVYHIPTAEGEGLREQGYDQMIETITNTI
ncbi:MAG: VWA domain-containing protein [Eubacteriales bacterium]